MNDSGTATHLPLGIKLLVAFFTFGAAMCCLTIVLLSWPGTSLDRLWELNPTARVGFRSLGVSAVVLMTIVASACAVAAIGLGRDKRWGRWLAISILIVNLAGDSVNAIARGDLRTLIGLPIAGGLIFYLWPNRGDKTVSG